MKNLSLRADAIKEKAKKGYPDGISSEMAVKDISVLLSRIVELERALIPFVSAGITPNYNDSMVLVMHKNCVDVAAVMDRQNSHDSNHQVQEFIPAEY